MRTDDVTAFLTVAELGSLRRSAERLGLTQSALSKVLARLEKRAGMRLFERTPRGVSLTDAGRALVVHGGHIRASLAQLEGVWQEQRSARAGTVRFGVLAALLPHLLPAASAFLRQRPLASLRLEAHQSAPLVDMLHQGHIDLALAAMPESLPEGLSYVSLPVLTVHVIARSDHPRLGRLDSLEALSRERWVLPGSSHFLRDWLERRFAQAGLPPVRVAVEGSTAASTLATLVRDSDFLGVLSGWALREPVTAGLTVVAGDLLDWRHELVLCWRTGAELSALCQDFRDAIAQHFREVPADGRSRGRAG